MNLKKFGSPHLDTPSSRYEFLEFAFKSVKINQEKHFKYQLTARTRGSMGPTHQQHTKQGHGFTGEKLIDGEVASGSVTTDVFPNSTHTYRYPWFARRITEASLSMSMVVLWWRVVVLHPSPAMAWPGERGYDIYEP